MMTWAELMDVIKTHGTEDELDIMQAKEFTIAELAQLFEVTAIRIYQLQKRKKNPLPISRSNERSGRNLWTIKEIPLLEWIEQEETKTDPRKKVNYAKVREVFNEIFERRDEIIDKYLVNIES